MVYIAEEHNRRATLELQNDRGDRCKVERYKVVWREVGRGSVTVRGVVVNCIHRDVHVGVVLVGLSGKDASLSLAAVLYGRMGE